MIGVRELFQLLLKRLRNFFKPWTSYGILRPCLRCVYAKRYEPVLIISKTRGPRIIVNLNGKTYVRRGPCIGYEHCGKCFEAVEGKVTTPCNWEVIGEL